ncbi:hypothetical protein [uncultured Brevibacillus sp.]|uniref:hypothetical protein n=1 Tax=uncultured Brevibacillus sp. TaxID=169970 RepID=UPI002595F821|nr:hypothetical protein [uncultured Brevibacillus sp.]
MSKKLPKKCERTAKALMNKYKGTGKRVELITEDGAFVLIEGNNDSGDYIEIIDDDDQIEIVVEG